jgi:hypothetical protein
MPGPNSSREPEKLNIMPPRRNRRVSARSVWFLILGFLPTLALAADFSAQLSASPAQFQGACPATIRFTGEIRAAKPGKVQFKFVRSDGASSAVQTLLFSAPGSKPISTTWTLGGQAVTRYQGWQAIEFVHPPTGRSPPANFSIQCAGKPR